MTAILYRGDCLTSLRRLPSGGVRCCVTSPPYWGLRDYGVAGQLGLEPTPDAYVAGMVEVFREVRRVLAEDGTLWLNLGDTFATQGGAHGARTDNQRGVGAKRTHALGGGDKEARTAPDGYKPKDLLGIPWSVAFALRADGWYLRSDIVWHKPNPLPESVTDRPTKAHEYVFLLTKSARYFYNADGIAEPSVSDPRRPSVARGGFAGKTDGPDAPAGRNAFRAVRPTRNARDVWTIAVRPYPGAHFATFPEELPRRCILAGSAPGDTVLDPFAGTGTTGAVAVGLGRSAILCELNPAYIELARQRIGPMLCEVAA